MKDRDQPPTETDEQTSTPRPVDQETPRGVRIEYRARVPRHLMGVAFAEALAFIHRETQQQDDQPPSTDGTRNAQSPQQDC